MAVLTQVRAGQGHVLHREEGHVVTSYVVIHISHETRGSQMGMAPTEN